MSDFSRRKFLKTGAAALAGITIAPSSILGMSHGHVSPTDKLNLAAVGIGGMGHANINNVKGTENIVALCDVDWKYAKGVFDEFPNAKKYWDYRKMYDEMGKSIDGVIIATADHTHAIITADAMTMGKHVYCQKPLTHSVYESRLLTNLAASTGVVTQMGNQGHSEANYYQFKAWKEAGLIKDVTAITAHMNSPRRWHGWNPNIKHMPMGEPIPETMDWDTWLGVVQHHDYNHDYHMGQWRCWYDFGMGALGDWGAHILDTAHEFLDLGLPSEVNPLYLKDHNPFFYPMSSTILFKFPERNNMPAVDVTWYDGLDNIPAVPENFGSSDVDPNIPTVAGGKLQLMKLNPGKEIYSKTLTFKGGSHGSTLSVIPDQVAKDMNPKLPEYEKSTSNHYANFLLACQGKEKTRSPFSIAGPLSQVFCMGVLAQRLNRKLVFDRVTKEIVNDDFANQMLVGEPPRKGWEEYYNV